MLGPSLIRGSLSSFAALLAHGGVGALTTRGFHGLSPPHTLASFLLLQLSLLLAALRLALVSFIHGDVYRVKCAGPATSAGLQGSWLSTIAMIASLPLLVSCLLWQLGLSIALYAHSWLLQRSKEVVALQVPNSQVPGTS